MDTIYIGNAFDLFFDAATLRATGAPQNAGTCTYALQTAAGVAVSGGSGTLSYVSGTDGNYLGYVTAAVTATLTSGAVYKVVYTFALSGVTQAVITKEFRAGTRKAS